MCIVHFVKIVGKNLNSAAAPLSAMALKKDLDSYNLGTERIRLHIEGDTVIIGGAIVGRAAFEKMVVAVGNILGIAAVNVKGVRILDAGGRTVNTAAGDTHVTAQGQLIYYIVRYGDDLWRIAEKLFGPGSGGKGGLIFEANRPMLAQPNKIYPGQLLRIPALRQ